MIDHLALLPAYCAAGTALLAFLADLLAPGRRLLVVAAMVAGTAATGVGGWLAYRDGPRRTFCVADGACSYVWDATAMLIGILFAAVTLIVVALSASVLRSAADLPVGEYCFLLAGSMTGGVVLAASRDLITLIVALETLTLPLYVLVGLRRRSLASAEAAITFFVVSVVSTAVTLLGAALLYGATGSVHFAPIASSLSGPRDVRAVPLVLVAGVLVLAGLAFKVAAVPFHAWAPSTYDGAPLPIAAYLSTASKLGGVIALVYVTAGPLASRPGLTGTFFTIVAALTMTVGNLVALRQRRMVRLLAWSSVAQAGYILAPLGALAFAPWPAGLSVAVTAALSYAVFFIVLELLAFGAVIALRGAVDGGTLADYAGAVRGRPWVSAVFVLALAGLAGLPPGLAGLFAKVTVVRALLGGNAGWLAVIVAVNAVVGLAYYVRAGRALFAASPLPPAPASSPASVPSSRSDLPVAVASPPAPSAPWPRIPIGVVLALTALTAAAIVAGFAPQLVLTLSTP
jgi:NADH-quinone oxidoreductase subunit N